MISRVDGRRSDMTSLLLKRQEWIFNGLAVLVLLATGFV
jgi:hypothetical protein